MKGVLHMEKGMAIIERDEVATKAIFIDQEIIEFARQNARTKKRVADAQETTQKVEMAKTKKTEKAEKEEARKRAYTNNTIAYMLKRGGIIVAVNAAAKAGLIAPVISAPVIILCLCAVCIRFGVWLGKGGVKNA